MKNKDERIQELKQIVWILFMGVILATSLMAYSTGKATNLEQELQSCQEDFFEIRGSYQIAFHCEYGWMNQTIISDYHDYESYQNALKSIGKSGYGDCEVIK